MPMYEFTCKSCEGRFEELIFNERDEKDLACPSCGSQKVERALSAFAISMKGGSGQSLPSCPSTGAPCGKAGGGFS